jgi:hypothetical protein
LFTVCGIFDIVYTTFRKLVLLPSCVIFRQLSFTNERETYEIITQSVRFQVLTAASMKFRIVFLDVLPCKIIVGRQLFYTAVHPRRQFWTSDNLSVYLFSVPLSACLSVCPPVTFEETNRFSWNSGGRSCYWGDFEAIIFNPIADVQTSEVDAKPAQVSTV